jgi:hypothetical protein
VGEASLEKSPFPKKQRNHLARVFLFVLTSFGGSEVSNADRDPEILAAIQQKAAAAIEAAKAQGMSILYPTASVRCRRNRDVVGPFQAIEALRGRDGTFRAIRSLDGFDIAQRLPETEAEQAKERRSVINEIDSMGCVFQAPPDDAEERTITLCFWSEPDNPYPGTPEGSKQR